jgi:hypothetical protein
MTIFFVPMLGEKMYLFEKMHIVASREQVSCALGGDVAILNLKNGVYYGLDPMGARIWNLLQQPRTLAELRDILINEYDVDAARLELDIQELLSQLVDNQLVEISR